MTDKLQSLETFLESRQAEGERIQSGAGFTIRRDLVSVLGFGEVDLQHGLVLSELSQFRALQTMADSLLPFPHAWLVKVIQGVVASERCREIRFELHREQTVITLEGFAWDFQELIEGFLDPKVSEDRALGHLKQALWAIALTCRWSFTLYLSGLAQALHWDGRKLSLGSTPTAAPQARLVVHFPEPEEKRAADWKARVSGQLQELTRRGFVCPLPLWADGRRIDGLQHCPSHGLGPRRQIIALGNLYARLPSIGLPPGSGLAGEIAPGESPVFNPEHCRMLYSLAAYSGSDRQSGLIPPKGDYARVYWVQDGAIVDEERLLAPLPSFSVALYLSSEGLVTDMSGFRLRRSEERERRVLEACETLIPVLGKMESAGLRVGCAGGAEVPISKSNGAGRQTLMFGALGVGLSFFWPFGAALAFGASIYGLGRLISGESGSKEGPTEPFVMPPAQEFSHLVEALEARLKDLPPGSPDQRASWAKGRWD